MNTIKSHLLQNVNQISNWKCW